MSQEEQIQSAPNLGALADLISSCQRCPLAKSKKMDVVGVGDEKAKIMFIGEAPGKQEDEQGEPFVGAAGKFLNEMLESIGLQRADIYITNVLKHRPPENRDPSNKEIIACWPYLSRQIELIDPTLIIFLGRHAMNRFFPDLKISEAHGQSFTNDWAGKKQKFLALYHPAAALYNGGMREAVMADFNKIPKILKEAEQEIISAQPII